jgi:Integrase core domain
MATRKCDNRPELACAAMADWAGERVGLHFIPPGQPWRNGYTESFNSRVRPLTAAPMSRASVGCVLRASGGPIDLDRYALRVGSRVDQVKRNVRAGVGEQPRALAEDYGDDEQVHLVD